MSGWPGKVLSVRERRLEEGKMVWKVGNEEVSEEGYFFKPFSGSMEGREVCWLKALWEES